VFGDPQLDALIRQVDVSNQNLKAFEAAFRAAQAGVSAARAGLFPTLSVGGTAQRSQSGGITGQPEPPPVTAYGVSIVSASWQPDLWGRIRRTIEANQANAQASAGDLASARLAAEAELAADYLQLRIADALKRLLDETVVAFRESLRIATNQYNAGIVGKADVVSAQTQLRSTEAQAINVEVARAQFEHAIAAARSARRRRTLTIAPVETAAGRCRCRRSGCPRPCSSGAPTSPRRSGASAASNARDRRRGGGLLSRHHADRAATAPRPTT
jgi:outer membrane protein TolC